ncbi:hypothetical protein [Salinibacterium sp. UTAS2018]|uniref:hypothetical protein n=1 Tax=Salinibacterium sp. UTAS2018 TaxID=2508880 RepID=UPI001FEF7EC6|nr:hypothetical protein [Salinibacterium sp. UTAS2018]
MKIKRRGLRLFLTGIAIIVIGSITSVIYLLQPWRTCDYDDTPTACAMLPADAAVLTVAMLAVGIAVFVTLAGVVQMNAQKPAEKTIE